jgi:hypothetical protein
MVARTPPRSPEENLKSPEFNVVVRRYRIAATFLAASVDRRSPIAGCQGAFWQVDPVHRRRPDWLGPAWR